MPAALSLDVIDVPDPCPVPWSAMTGSDRIRHCGQCRKPVYNLSAMTRDEAEDLIRAKDGGLCVQFYRRADGTVATAQCNRAVRFSRRTAAAVVGILAGLVVLTAGVSAFGRGAGSGVPWYERVGPFRRAIDWLSPPTVRGEICPLPIQFVVPKPAPAPRTE